MTNPVKATYLALKHFRKQEASDTLVPGTFSLDPAPEEDADMFIHYCCPCGCGVTGRLRIGVEHKPTTSPSWIWNAKVEKASLDPSVNHVGHWHGWLKDGYWTECS